MRNNFGNILRAKRHLDFKYLTTKEARQIGAGRGSWPRRGRYSNGRDPTSALSDLWWCPLATLEVSLQNIHFDTSSIVQKTLWPRLGLVRRTVALAYRNIPLQPEKNPLVFVARTFSVQDFPEEQNTPSNLH